MAAGIVTSDTKVVIITFNIYSGSANRTGIKHTGGLNGATHNYTKKKSEIHETHQTLD